MEKQRTPYLIPPRYDIDALLSADYTSHAVAIDIPDQFWGALDAVPESSTHWYYRPDSSLYYPEVMVRDFLTYDTMTNNGFATGLFYSGGVPAFYRGLRAVRALGHKKATELMERALAVFKANGIPEFTSFPDDPLCGECPDWDKEGVQRMHEAGYDLRELIDNELSPLYSEWWNLDSLKERFDPDNPSVRYRICEYLNEHRELLRSRKA
jgi:hypothetical protein